MLVDASEHIIACDCLCSRPDITDIALEALAPSVPFKTKLGACSTRKSSLLSTHETTSRCMVGFEAARDLGGELAAAFLAKLHLFLASRNSEHDAQLAVAHCSSSQRSRRACCAHGTECSDNSHRCRASKVSAQACSCSRPLPGNLNDMSRHPAIVPCP